MTLSEEQVSTMLHAALDAAAGPTSKPAAEPADLTPPDKVRKAAAAVPGIAFNLDQQYGGIDPAAARKLGIEQQAADG